MSKTFPFRAGDVLLSTTGEVSKILVVEQPTIHVRFYTGTYTSIEAVKVALAANQLSWFFGHAPVAEEGVLDTHPRLVGNVPVTEEELEGYRCYIGDIPDDGED